MGSPLIHLCRLAGEPPKTSTACTSVGHSGRHAEDQSLARWFLPVPFGRWASKNKHRVHLSWTLRSTCRGSILGTLIFTSETVSFCKGRPCTLPETTLLESNISHPKALFRMIFPLPRLGYGSSLEGNSSPLKIHGWKMKFPLGDFHFQGLC